MQIDPAVLIDGFEEAPVLLRSEKRKVSHLEIGVKGRHWPKQVRVALNWRVPHDDAAFKNSPLLCFATECY